MSPLHGQVLLLGDPGRVRQGGGGIESGEATFPGTCGALPLGPLRLPHRPGLCEVRRSRGTGDSTRAAQCAPRGQAPRKGRLGQRASLSHQPRARTEARLPRHLHPRAGLSLQGSSCPCPWGLAPHPASQGPFDISPHPQGHTPSKDSLRPQNKGPGLTATHTGPQPPSPRASLPPPWAPGSHPAPLHSPCSLAASCPSASPSPAPPSCSSQSLS